MLSRKQVVQFIVGVAAGGAMLGTAIGIASADGGSVSPGYVAMAQANADEVLDPVTGDYVSCEITVGGPCPDRVAGEDGSLGDVDDAFVPFGGIETARNQDGTGGLDCSLFVPVFSLLDLSLLGYGVVCNGEFLGYMPGYYFGPAPAPNF